MVANNLTDFASLTSQQVTAWSALVIIAGRDASFWMGTKGFMGEGTRDSTKPIHYVTELTATDKGARAIMPLVQDLEGDGVVGDNRLEDNEEPLSVDDIEINIDQIRHGVKSKGRMSEQKTVLQFRAQARDKLAYWKGSKTDEILFLVASGVSFTNKLDGSSRSTTSQLPLLGFAADVSAPSTGRRVFAGTANSTATLTVSDKMSWNLLVRTKALAIRKRIKPIRINSADSYAVVMSPEAARDLKQDADYKAIAAAAANRGPKNELFTGAFLNVDGLILFEHTKVYTTFGLGSGSKWGAAGTVDGSLCLLLGAQALGYAQIGQSDWQESDNTDYKNRAGIAYGCKIGAVKSKFKSRYDANASEDFSLISIYVAAAA